MRLHLGNQLFDRLPFSGVYREESASPATGSSRSHRIEQAQLISVAFADL